MSAISRGNELNGLCLVSGLRAGLESTVNDSLEEINRNFS